MYICIAVIRIVFILPLLDVWPEINLVRECASRLCVQMPVCLRNLSYPQIHISNTTLHNPIRSDGQIDQQEDSPQI